MSEPADSPRETQRFVLLGASNLTNSFPLILENLRQRFAGPLKIYAALGHGRSFGHWSTVFGRSLPGISQSGLWEHIASEPPSPGPVRALITDVGNDLVYDVPVPQIVAWLEENFRKLVDMRADTVVTLLPMGSVEKLQPWRYYVARTMLFPTRRCPWPEMRRRVYDLNDQLQQLCGRYGAKVFTPPGDWYGFDPIHIVRPRRAQAWTEILSHWEGLANGEVFARASLGAVGKFLRSCPAERRFFGVRQKRTQPTLEFDELSVSLF